MESAWQGATFYRGTSRTDAQKLDCHRKVFRIRIRQHLTQGLGIHRAPLPCPNTLGKRDSGAPNKRNLGFGSANFSKCMWIWHMCHNDFFSASERVSGNAWDTTGLLAATPLEDPGAAQESFLWQPNFCVPAQENPLYNGAACHVDSILKAFTTFW